MKYHDSDSNSVVSACVQANNLDCREYNVIKADKTIKCWIPVDTGKTITLGCDVRTPATRYQIDLIVDGVLRDTKMVEKKSPRLRHELFEEVYFREKTLVQRGTMKVVGLSRKARSPKNVSPEAVGTLEIRLYKNETGSDVHKPSSTSFLEVESWRDLAGLQDTSNIDPTHEIQFVGGTSLTPRSLNTLKARLEEERLGSKPWLSFKFFYRSYFAAMLAKPNLQASLEPVKELPSSIPALTAGANRGSKSGPAQMSNADKQNAEKDRDRISKSGKNHHTTEGLHTELHPTSIPSKHLCSKKRDNIPPTVVQSITASTISISDPAPSHGHLKKEAATAQRQPILPPLPSRAPCSDCGHPDGLAHKPLRSTASFGLARLLSDQAIRNAAKRHRTNTPENIDVDDRLKIENSGSATVKRRKLDVDQLRAELAEERCVMEGSKRHVEGLRRKTDERQRQLNEEWDDLQRLRLEYRANIEENQRQAKAVSKELEEMDRAKP